MPRLTCHTPGCGNADIPIQLDVDADAYACGVCGEPITDVVVVTQADAAAASTAATAASAGGSA